MLCMLPLLGARENLFIVAKEKDSTFEQLSFKLGNLRGLTCKPFVKEVEQISEPFPLQISILRYTK